MDEIRIIGHPLVHTKRRSCPEPICESGKPHAHLRRVVVDYVIYSGVAQLHCGYCSLSGILNVNKRKYRPGFVIYYTVAGDKLRVFGLNTLRRERSGA